MNESVKIVNHLWAKYSDSVEPSVPRPGDGYHLAPSRNFGTLERGVVLPVGHKYSTLWKVLDIPTMIAASVMRPLPSHGTMITPSRTVQDTDQIQLYGHEGCAASRLIREALSSLQLPYLLIPVAEGSQHESPNGVVPCLVHGEFSTSNDEEAVEYLFKTYATGPTISYFNH
mmetsp:Transcript_27306/g.42683  ORF Transcript_27306/g.42683 Transcript_27306/m.42683 type:complete len:172 (-) Transcript_27306:385-900(-)|eukprot:CAMPEP_0184297706 /NCGR_PEP_ID=MMETSP1049-20130417/8593_1 /TAXON_ID=77928 /ORGANISM="Proteomonas sulcata, Strain CCMP704" /LENGTH=171 /DNA_ID=CAMNT_0026607547 /DNA_START=109 /DNA_END=624 /DNA_ORIENTATION=+